MRADVYPRVFASVHRWRRARWRRLWRGVIVLPTQPYVLSIHHHWIWRGFISTSTTMNVHRDPRDSKGVSCQAASFRLGVSDWALLLGARFSGRFFFTEG